MAGIVCPEIGLRIATLALLLGRLQAARPPTESSKKTKRIVTIFLFISIIHQNDKPVKMTKEMVKEFPTQVNR